MDDAVSRCLDVDIFNDPAIFDDIEFVDFYRYSDASLDEILNYLATEAPWARPADTGRSTNCLINDVGIHVHKTERGFHNYSLPYSWDVRLGHKQRDAARDELDDAIDLQRTNDILTQIGYQPVPHPKPASAKGLCAWYVSSTAVSANRLRDWLLDCLPQEYIPSHFVAMDALPLTPNDKVDRAKLPPPQASRSLLATEYVAPDTSIERTLTQIWQDVLGAPSVGVNDNFFELGGDSILSIQLVTRAEAAGVNLTPQQIFEQPTVRGLAAVAGRVHRRPAEQGAVVGPVSLLPVQHDFFRRYPEGKSAFSQCALFSLTVACSKESVQSALDSAVAQHDALRSLFSRADDGSWQARLAAPSEIRFAVQVSELDAPGTAAFETVIENQILRATQNLSLADGRLLQAVFFAANANREAHLLLVVHHLLIDGVSWWILRDDLDRHLVARHEHHDAITPAKTHSVKQWADALEEFALQPSVLAQRSYWATQLATPATGLAGSSSSPAQVPTGQRSMPSTRGAGRQSVSKRFDAGSSLRLLHELPASYGVRVHELLLLAVVESVPSANPLREVAVAVETHGREAISEDLDLLRTVGWFTSIHPLLLRYDDALDPGAKLQTIKEQLRAPPYNGIGFGVLRYLSQKRNNAPVLAPGAEPDILFNYLGQWNPQRSEVDVVRFARPLKRC
jgi:aryl carrier-like protein